MDWDAIDSDGNDIGADTDSDYDSDDYTANYVMVIGAQKLKDPSGRTCYKCPIDGCHVVFPHLGLLHPHVVHKHLKRRKPYKCICGKKYPNALRLANHKKYNTICMLHEVYHSTTKKERIKKGAAKK